MRDFLQVLGIPEDARASDIRRACRQRVDRAHPDFQAPDRTPAHVTPDAPAPDLSIDFAPMPTFLERIRSDFFASGA